MQPHTPLVLATATLFTILLSACGDGGAGSATAAAPVSSLQVTGTVAYGQPVAGQSVYAMDSTQLVCATASTASDGTYSMNSRACKPGAISFYVPAYTTPGGAPLESVAIPSHGSSGINGVVNIDPLTTLVAYYAAGLIANANPPTNNTQVLASLPQITAAQYQQALTSVLTAPLLRKLQANGVPTTGFDPISTPFVANGQGVDAFFDAYPLSATGTGVKIAAPSAPGPLVQITLPGTAGGEPTVTSTAAYTIGGNVSGLSAGSLSLLMNGANPFSITANGAFTFPNQVSSTYAITVGTQPVGQVCTVSNGAGSGLTANVSNVSVACSTLSYTIGGTVSGLASGAQLVFNDNGADPVTVTTNGGFTFATRIAYNGGYNVTVAMQPTGQTCTVSNGSGLNVTTDVTAVSVTCSASTYTIGGSVAGLGSGLQITLLNNGGDANVVTANTNFTFATPVAYQGSYAVTVGTQPNGQSCTVVSNGSGANVAANITNVSVTCTDNPVYFYVGDYGNNDVLGYDLDPITGASSSVPGGPFAAGTYDRWVAASPAGTFVYAVNQNSHNVSAYRVAASTGTLTAVPGSPFDTGGSVPEFVMVNAAGTYAYVANTGGGTVAVFSIDATTGALTPVAGSPFAAEQPTRIAINPAGTFAYVVNNTNDIGVYAIDQTTGALTPISGSPFANSTNVGGLQSITINAAGTFAYGANGWGSISGFSVDPITGALTMMSGSPFTTTAGGGTWVELNPAGTFAYLAGGNGGYVLTFSVDPTTGALTKIAGGSCGAYPNNGVIYIKMNPAGTYAYMANGLAINVEVCSVDPSTGALTDVPGSPIWVGARPVGIGVVQH